MKKTIIIEKSKSWNFGKKIREKGDIFGNFSVFCPYFREKSCYHALSIKFQKFKSFLQHDIFCFFLDEFYILETPVKIPIF